MPTLDWENKSDALRAVKKIPYRLLEFDSVQSCGDDENLIVQGDNLDALNSLLPFYRGRVKCIYIDPPYNTHSAFEHYDDNFEHAEWLSMMYPRLELLRDFLSDDGAIFISVDDEEAHYLKVICDEIFGRKNFVASILWQKRTSPDMRLSISTAHDYIFLYAKDKESLTLNKLRLSDEQAKNYKNPDNDPRGLWTSTDCTAQAGHGTKEQFYDLTTPSGRVIKLPSDRCWRYTQKRMNEQIADNRIWFGKDGKGVPRKKTFLSESVGQTPWTWWSNKEVGHNQESKKETKALGLDFETPKPTRLLERILTLATDKNSLVLDAFAGSGTTAHAVINLNATDGGARKFILIEEKEYCKTITAERVRRVGGSFKFFRVGAKLFDETGALNPSVTARELAAFIWFKFTGRAYPSEENLPLIGIFEGAAYYLASEPLTKKFLATLPAYDGQKIIFGATSRVSADFLSANKIIFKQLPSEIKA